MPHEVLPLPAYYSVCAEAKCCQKSGSSLAAVRCKYFQIKKKNGIDTDIWKQWQQFEKPGNCYQSAARSAASPARGVLAVLFRMTRPSRTVRQAKFFRASVL